MSRTPRTASPLLPLLTLAFAAMILPLTAHAQTPSGEGPHGHGGQPGMMAGGDAPEMVLERMKTRLKLTPEQEAQLKPILEENAKKLRELRDKHLAANQGQPTPPDPEMRKQMMALRDENDARIVKVLTPAQAEEWKKMRAEARERMEQRMKGGPGGDAPPPPPNQK